MLYVVEKVRLGIGETNSSSTHCFTVGSDSFGDNMLSLLTNHIKDNDMTLMPFLEFETEFGWREDTYSSIQDLWNYVVIGAGCCGESTQKKLIGGLEHFLDIEGLRMPTVEVFENHFWFVDHQSMHEVIEAIDMIADGHASQVFNGAIETGNDN